MLSDPRTTARYALAKPAGTHRRAASCAEVECKHYRQGWQMHIAVGTPRGRRQLELIKASGRRYRQLAEPGGWLLQFEAGQNCYAAHSVPLDRPALYVVRQGDSAPRVHTRPEYWVEDFSTHLDKLREQ